jgi:hypothetical protein
MLYVLCEKPNRVFHYRFFTKKPSRCEKLIRVFKRTFRGFSQHEKPYRVGFVICVGEKTPKNPYF